MEIQEEGKNYLAAGLSNEKVNIYNKENHLCQEITPKGKNNILKNEDQYSVISLSIDNNGEFLFIAYKNGVIIPVKLDLNNYNFKEENIKMFIDNKYEINTILFESKFFTVISIGDSKGFKIKSIKGKNTYFEDNSDACYSICFDVNKNYLFAEFEDGIIRVYQFKL